MGREKSTVRKPERNKICAFMNARKNVRTKIQYARGEQSEAWHCEHEGTDGRKIFFFMISKLFHSRSDTLTRVAKT